jgi:hypothetical protein
LPTSPYEPAGGIFCVGGPAERIDRGEETRVELSLVRLLSPGREESRDDERLSDQNPATSPSPPLDTDPASPGAVVVRVGATASDESRSDSPGARPFLPTASVLARGASGPADRRPFDLAIDGLVPPDAEDPVGGSPWVTAATLPPIDGSDRSETASPAPRRDDATGDEEPSEWRSGPGGAILLGLGGSAVLGVGLYAPDLAGAIRRAVPSRSTSPRSHPTSSGGVRARQ